MNESEETAGILARSDEIARRHLQTGYRTIDRYFAVLLFVEWIAAMILALTFSPLAWAGEFSKPHLHVWIALILGGLIVSLPIALTKIRTGEFITRAFICISQMLMVGLIIQLSGGRPEFHFHVFVSLAFLAFYLDWRLLAIGGTVVAIDHFLREIYWPRSVFGLVNPGHWRWVEHSLWMVFEGSVLSFGISRSLFVIREDSRREAEIEATRDRIERLVEERTAELLQTNDQLRLEIIVRRVAEIEAIQSRQIADKAALIKSEFLANMSHEIRTPMNAIIGMTELTLDMAMPTAQRENLEIVRHAANSLLFLIDQILDLSKIEANRLDLESIEFSLRETVQNTIKILANSSGEKGLQLALGVAENVPPILVGDPHRLRQILINLIGNAIKFTTQGTIAVAVRVEHEEAEYLDLLFSIRDEGIGIPESRLTIIFDPFIQGDGSTTRRFGGTGLGLSICSRLVELMNGRIWVESEVDRGSTFSFTARFGKASTNFSKLAADPRQRTRSTASEA